MLHRTTWIAIPVVAVVVVGAGLGWWGWDQQRQKQALALQAENQYEVAFHSLVNDMTQLREELGKAAVTGDEVMFRSSVRQAWRYTYAAQTNAARLPMDLMPMHNVQTYLASVATDCDNWLTKDQAPVSAKAEALLKLRCQQAGQLETRLTKVQSQMAPDHMQFIAVNQALKLNRADNQVIDGFRKMDGVAGAFGMLSDKPATRTPPASLPATEALINSRQAVSALGEFVGVAKTNPWNVQRTGAGATIPSYTIAGDTPLGQLHGIVTERGGHVVSFQIAHIPASGNYDLAQARGRAENWLKTRGFSQMSRSTARESNNVGYFSYTALYQGVPVVNQQVNVSVALDNRQMIGYDGSKYILSPVRNLPSRVFTIQSLQQRLNDGLTVRSARPVIVLDKTIHYQPAAEFVGTSGGETYRVYVNAHTGHEIDIEQLTDGVPAV